MNERNTARREQDDASSSLNVRFFRLSSKELMVIKTREQISPEVLKISSDTGSAFFLRTVYLSLVGEEEIFPCAEFCGEREDDIIDAGLSYSAEVKAEEYLARSEQSRFGLSRKLINKNYGKKYIEKALDYLEEKNFLSDLRFSRAWLSLRKLNHFEGRIKLSSELASRGIGKEDSEKVLDEFFSENSEEELCRKCYEKLLRNSSHSSSEKIIRSMQQKGFSYSLIKRILKDEL